VTYDPRDHRIPLTEAKELTRRYRESVAQDAFKAGALHAKQVQELLAQPGCVTLRVYLGRQADGKETLVLVGVDDQDRDMTGGIMLDVIYPCPPFCEGGGGLNS
jgi:hypothetical protein